ncbi:MAG: hypothetical protein ABI778_08890 [Ignavibacteriota bacterium]
MTTAKVFSAFFICLIWCACGTDTPPDPKVTRSTDSAHYEFHSLGIAHVRSGDNLVLWVKIAPDPEWHYVRALPIIFIYPGDSVIFNGYFYCKESLDRVQGVMITLERTTKPTFPGVIIARSDSVIFDSAAKESYAVLDATNYLGDYSTLAGSLDFTSPLPDTTSYRHEFYLMDQVGQIRSPSLVGLNSPPTGWRYSLWAIDSNFTPHQYFHFGSFTSAEGHDNDSLNDNYAFPGGWKPQAMNIPSGYILVTLEPELYGDSLKFKGPSAFSLLSFKRIYDIVADKNYVMTNVSRNTIPKGMITFTKN